MDFAILLIKTVVLRPYVFVFLAAALFCAQRLIGWRRTGRFFVITWITALLCELSSTRNGFPFGLYHYTMATKGQELYILNVPFMDSVSFPFLLYASYCMALAFLLPTAEPAPKRSGNWQLVSLTFPSPIQSSKATMGLTALFYVWVDMVLDPVALHGDRWFLGHIYDYAEPGVHFGVPLTNYLGWAMLGLTSLGVYFALDRRFPVKSKKGDPHHSVTGSVLLGCGLYYGVLAFILAVAFWIGESLLGTIGVLMYIPITALLVLRLTGRMPAQRLIVRRVKVERSS